MTPQELLAKLSFESTVSQIWEDIDKHSFYGVYFSMYSLPDNPVLAELVFDEFASHSQIKKAELKTSDEGFYTLELRYPEKEGAARKSRTVKKKG